MTEQLPIAAVTAAAAAPDARIVTEVTHYTEKLFSFRVTRPRSLRFRSGEFVMIGLPGDSGKPVLRAYSIASPAWDDELEFYSIKVPDGPLTSRLQKIAPGDRVIVRTKPTGTLVLDALLPARRVYLFATGTGIAPFASLVRDPDIYARFDEVVLTHTCRSVAELAYGQRLVANMPFDPLVGEAAAVKLRYYPTTTQENSARNGRITQHIRSGALFEALGAPPLSVDDRVMICGSMPLNLEVKALCEAAGMREGANSAPGHYVLEKAFVGEAAV
ncbi:MAG: ferredoxin--NADP reductase [Paracoccaceae bacterium]